MPITLKDIADRTGVSPSVVSTVLSGRDNGTFVSPATRERVMRVAQELNYTPVRSGRPRGSRRLRRQRVDQFVGIWDPESDSASAAIIKAVQSALRQYAFDHTGTEEIDYDYGLRLLVEEDLPRLDMLGVLGLIVVGDLPLPRTAAAANIPTVLLGEIDHPPHELVTVHLDNFAAGRAIGDHLWSLGHQRVAFVAPSATPRVTRQRWQGLQSVWVDQGAPSDGCIPAPYDTKKELPLREQVITTVKELFSSDGKPCLTALVAFNETVAAYTVQALSALGLHVPSDVSLATFGDSPNGAEAQAVAVTTIRPPVKQLVASAVAQLYNLSRDAELESVVPIGLDRRDLVFPGELIVRDSTAHATEQQSNP